MQNKTKGIFSPVSVVKQKRPVWMTPGINPNEEVTFTPVSVIPMADILALVRQIYNR